MSEEIKKQIDEADAAERGLEFPTDVYTIIAFSFQMITECAWQAMGLSPNPKTRAIEQNFEQAKVAVDTAAFLAEKLEDKLEPTEMRDVKNKVQNLKLNYVKQLSMAQTTKSEEQTP